MNEKLIALLTDVAQLLDGWHTDVAWTDWDESVRKRVSEILIVLYLEQARKAIKEKDFDKSVELMEKRRRFKERINEKG